jgi:hypothetical protein
MAGRHDVRILRVEICVSKKKKKIVNTISGIPLDSPRQQQLQVHYQ